MSQPATARSSSPNPASTSASADAPLTRPTYCTILATNYLPRALALAGSLRRCEDGTVLKILFIDVERDAELPRVDGVECLSLDCLGLPRRAVLNLAMVYDLVELATAVKPLLLRMLLQESDQVVYLDPDTYVTSPLVELAPALDDSPGGILLTPHFLRTTPQDAQITEGHLLLVGVYNLGFCAVDKRARVFLDWWWSHLDNECLYDPLSGLFFDQKWVDIGSTLFEAACFRHAGYNVGVANLPERPLERDADGLYISSTFERLRLFHFHAFDSATPHALSTRFSHGPDDLVRHEGPVADLCEEYAGVLSSFEQQLPQAPPYPYASDTRGRRISRQLRRAYRMESRGQRVSLPSPFQASEADAYDAWRRRAWRSRARGLLGDTAKCVRIVLPEEYERVKKRFPKVAARLNRHFADGSGLWG